MNPIIPIIRISTYLVGAIVGIHSGTPLGYLLSALLLANAVIVYLVERSDQVLKEDSWQAKGKELDLIGFQIGIPRKEYSIAGVKVKELDGGYRKRMREYLKGVTPPRGL